MKTQRDSLADFINHADKRLADLYVEILEALAESQGVLKRLIRVARHDGVREQAIRCLEQDQELFVKYEVELDTIYHEIEQAKP